MTPKMADIYMHDVDRWDGLVEAYADEGHATLDQCEECGEDFGDSGETQAGWNSECVHCGGRQYETKPTDRSHFNDWAEGKIEESRGANVVREEE